MWSFRILCRVMAGRQILLLGNPFNLSLLAIPHLSSLLGEGRRPEVALYFL
jgi:hypothetical protein